MRPEGEHRDPVVVVGAGVTGLAAAFELVGAGQPVVVLEAGSAVGGKLRSVSVAGIPVDAGPDAVVARRPEAVGLAKEAGLGDDLVPPGVSGAFVWARHRLRRLPEGLALGVPTRLGPLARSGILGPLGLARAGLDLLARRPAHEGPGDAAVGALVTRRLGRQVAARLADPLIGGIHAGPTAAMSSAAVFPPLLAAARTPGSLMRNLRPPAPPPSPPSGPAFLTLRQGLWHLAPVLAELVARRGGEVRLDQPVEALHPVGAGRWRVQGPGLDLEAAGVVLALPAWAAAQVLAEDPTTAGLGRRLGALEHASVAVATFAFRPGGPAERWRQASGTGYLVPAEQGLLGTGCTWLSSKWPHLAPGGPVLVRVSAGRDGDRRAEALDDQRLGRRLLAELRAVAGDVDEPLDAVVVRWPEAFPQYRVGHLDWVAQLEAATALHPGLALAGAYLRGVGVPACVAAGRAAARALLGQPAGSRA
ncbi:protoporphyrinogen oxidase [Aciditerrimonas ferrireducens]|uniref:protoporphyrinogen oxidase n=1 Tax=Aciditerrimonas ferrireducens TaxID=667306 RepID=UPI0028987052|nr:protoporphyrinogen oxidase [Aciditerrimonas ferrireducens]